MRDRLRFLALPSRLTRMLRWRARTLPLIARLTEPVNDLLDVLFEQSGTGMAIVDQGGDIVRVNPALARMGKDVAPGRPVLSLFVPELRDAVWSELRPVLDGSGGARPFISRLPGPEDGHHVRVLPVALREADGTCSGLVLRLYDTTVQTRLEVRLAHGERLQAAGQLAAGVAHDFNNLLTPILSVAEEALERPDLPPGLTGDLRLIRASADRGAALVRKMLAVGQQQALQPRVLAVDGVVHDLSGLLRRALGVGRRLDLRLEQPGLAVRADPVQLDRLLVNLVVNARNAMPDGGAVTLRTGQTVLAEPLAQRDDPIPAGAYATIEVVDEGGGIAPDILPRIFDPFFTTRREQGGSGLGLAAAHGIARQSGGFITVESQLGRGTCMRVHLPRHDGAPEEAPPAATAPEQPGAGRTVLLVEDEETLRHLMTRALRQRGWRVLAAGSAEDALALVAEHGGAAGLSLVVSDLALPGMTGEALVLALRQEWAGLPAILASGYAGPATHEAANAQSIAFLQKPYTPRALMVGIGLVLANEPA